MVIGTAYWKYSLQILISGIKTPEGVNQWLMCLKVRHSLVIGRDVFCLFPTIVWELLT